MIKFAREFPDPEIVATLSRQMSWSHFVLLLAIKSAETKRTLPNGNHYTVHPHTDINLLHDDDC